MDFVSQCQSDIGCGWQGGVVTFQVSWHLPAFENNSAGWQLWVASCHLSQWQWEAAPVGDLGGELIESPAPDSPSKRSLFSQNINIHPFVELLTPLFNEFS